MKESNRSKGSIVVPFAPPEEAVSKTEQPLFRSTMLRFLIVFFWSFLLLLLSRFFLQVVGNCDPSKFGGYFYITPKHESSKVFVLLHVCEHCFNILRRCLPRLMPSSLVNNSHPEIHLCRMTSGRYEILDWFVLMCLATEFQDTVGHRIKSVVINNWEQGLKNILLRWSCYLHLPGWRREIGRHNNSRECFGMI